MHLPALTDVTRIEGLRGYRFGNGRMHPGVCQDFLNDIALRQALPCMPYCAIWLHTSGTARRAGRS